MDLLSNLDDSKWRNEEPGKIEGLVDYIILRSKLLEPGKFEFELKVNAEDGNLVRGVIEGGQGKHNPIGAARNAEMKVESEKVVAINLDGDCVVWK